MITKKRIRSMKYYDIVNDGDFFFIGIKLTEKIIGNALTCGFSPNLKIGESVLPKCLGPVSKRNANGDTILLRELPKEDYSYTVLWRRKQWAGRDRTEEVIDPVEIHRKRFQREQRNIYNEYLTIIEKAGSKYIISRGIEKSEENIAVIIHITNLFLELFQKCEVLNSNFETFFPNTIKKLDWTILPQGTNIWENIKKYIDEEVNPKPAKKGLVYKRIKHLENRNFLLVAYGNAGFSGYLVFKHPEKNFYLFENPRLNNATYVFEDNWLELSKLTKKQIVENNHHTHRIIHNNSWETKIDDL